MTNLLLGFHLLGVVCFFVGGIVAGVLQLCATRQERPSEVYRFLRRAPLGAALLGTGALLTLGFGIALAEHKGFGLSPAWIQASLGLWVAAMALGAFGGRTARHARHLAQKLAAEGDEPSPELRALVSARGPLWASYASFLLLVVIVVLMVWQPGSAKAAASGPAVIPKSVTARILRDFPKLSYLPTRLPSGFEYAHLDPAYNNEGFHLGFKRANARLDELVFTVYPIALMGRAYCQAPPDSATFGSDTVNGYRIAWKNEHGLESALRCAKLGSATVLLEADAPPAAVDLKDLEALVAYAKPIS